MVKRGRLAIGQINTPVHEYLLQRTTRRNVNLTPKIRLALREMARVVRRSGRVITVDVMSAEAPEDSALHNALETLRDPSHVRMLPKSELHRLLAQAGLAVESCVEWTNHREFDEWLKIVSAPERVRPLKVVMSALARGGATAGIGLRLEGEKILFEHTAALTVAVKR